MEICAVLLIFERTQYAMHKINFRGLCLESQRLTSLSRSSSPGEVSEFMKGNKTWDFHTIRYFTKNVWGCDSFESLHLQPVTRCQSGQIQGLCQVLSVKCPQHLTLNINNPGLAWSKSVFNCGFQTVIGTFQFTCLPLPLHERMPWSDVGCRRVSSCLHQVTVTHHTGATLGMERERHSERITGGGETSTTF